MHCLPRGRRHVCLWRARKPRAPFRRTNRLPKLIARVGRGSRRHRTPTSHKLSWRLRLGVRGNITKPLLLLMLLRG